MREISLSEFGLETVAGACARKKWSPKSVQNWVKAGLLPAVPVGAGRGTYLLRVADVDAFETPRRGPKPGNQNAKKKPPAKKPRAKKG